MRVVVFWLMLVVGACLVACRHAPAGRWSPWPGPFPFPPPAWTNAVEKTT